MTINPYEPPQGPLVVYPIEPDVYPGPWRDGDLLVMPVDDSDECSLPMRCVITGVPVQRNQTLFAELAISQSFWTVGDQSLGVLWPLSNAARPRIRWFPIVGFLLLLLVISLWVRAYSQAMSPTDLDGSLLAITAVAAAIMIAMKFADDFRARPFLSVAYMEMELVWIAGAHNDFLRELPPWPGHTDE